MNVAVIEPASSFVERIARERASGSSEPMGLTPKRWTERIGQRGDKRAPVRVLGA